MPIAVVGAGQAGLSVAAALRRAGLTPRQDFVVLDGEEHPGGAWQHRWPTLLMRTVNGIHDLAGVQSGFVDDGSDARQAREAVPAYFAEIERVWDLRVLRPVRVRAVRSAERDSRTGPLDVETDHGTWRADALINATGTWTRPFRPVYPGAETFRGQSLHAREYPGPEALAGKRVVVVGGGSTAVQILLELAPYAAATTWVTRREPEWIDGRFDRERARAAIAKVEQRVRQGLPPTSVVGVTGLALRPDVRAALADGTLRRRPMFAEITPAGVRWDDGSTEPADVIVWATGFRSALGHLAPLTLRAPGGGIVMGEPLDTTVVVDPRVHLVGYGPSASTIGADRAGRAAARDALRRLGIRVSPASGSRERVAG